MSIPRSDGSVSNHYRDHNRTLDEEINKTLTQTPLWRPTETESRCSLVNYIPTNPFSRSCQAAVWFRFFKFGIADGFSIHDDFAEKQNSIEIRNYKAIRKRYSTVINRNWNEACTEKAELLRSTNMGNITDYTHKSVYTDLPEAIIYIFLRILCIYFIHW